jgi:hypothetical protein
MKPDRKILVEVIDRSDVVGFLAGLVHPRAISIAGVNDMVDKIISKATQEGGHNTIFRLNIIGHGNSGVQSVGGGPKLIKGKYLSSGVLTKESNKLGRLRPYLRKDALVILHGCNVAEGIAGSAFMMELSRVLGVPVIAGESSQYPMIPGMEGSIKKCTPVYCGNIFINF